MDWGSGWGKRDQIYPIWVAYRYLKQIQDLPSTSLPQMNLVEMYSLKDEMNHLR